MSAIHGRGAMGGETHMLSKSENISFQTHLLGNAMHATTKLFHEISHI